MNSVQKRINVIFVFLFMIVALIGLCRDMAVMDNMKTAQQSMLEEIKGLKNDILELERENNAYEAQIKLLEQRLDDI